MHGRILVASDRHWSTGSTTRRTARAMASALAQPLAKDYNVAFFIAI